MDSWLYLLLTIFCNWKSWMKTTTIGTENFSRVRSVAILSLPNWKEQVWKYLAVVGTGRCMFSEVNLCFTSSASCLYDYWLYQQFQQGKSKAQTKKMGEGERPFMKDLAKSVKSFYRAGWDLLFLADSSWTALFGFSWFKLQNTYSNYLINLSVRKLALLSIYCVYNKNAWLNVRC